MSAYNPNIPTAAPNGKEGHSLNGLPGAPPPPQQHQHLQNVSYQQSQLYPQQQQQIPQQQRPQPSFVLGPTGMTQVSSAQYSPNISNKFLPPPPPSNQAYAPISKAPVTQTDHRPLATQETGVLNGPTTVKSQVVLTNGGSGSSPMPPAPPPKPQLQHTEPPTVPPALHPVPITQPSRQQATAVPPANMANLTSNLQGLHINRANGPSLATNQAYLPPKDHRGVAVDYSNNFSPSVAKNQGVERELLSHNAVPNPFTSAAPPNQNAATIFGGTTGAKPPRVQPDKIPYGPQSLTSLPAGPPVSVALRAKFPAPIENLQQVAGQIPLQRTGLAPAPVQTAPQMRLPVPQELSQPIQAQLPQAPQTQPTPQQQQYPYATAFSQQQPYQHQVPTQGPPPGLFGPNSSNTPLQYQGQMLPPPGLTAPVSVAQQGFSRLWGQDTIDLMQNRHILSPATVTPPKVVLHNQFHESINCNPSIIRCTLAKIPESNSLLQKSRLPLGIVIHPFRDVNSLPVIQCINIVRCRLCRTYINPFVYFVDSKMWKCNLCYRVNELPEDFQFDPATKTYGDVTRRPEVRSSTIEFIAPSEYMLRPPQPAIYLFLFDVSIIAQQSGYLEAACSVLNKHLDEMPGDARTQVGFICYDSFVHFYSMAEGFNQPHEMTLLDIEDPFLPRPDSLLVNLKECKELVRDLLKQLPKRFEHTHDPGSALGAALQVAFKLMQSSGGRITVFQSCLPNKGPGALEPREDPNNRSAKDVAHLNPATDFYKRFALECSGYQIAVDLFLMNQQYSDLATISGVSKHSGGCMHHFPLYQKTKQHQVDSFRQCFKRYLTRKIGFEAVMRIRCTRGLQVHTFHGNFFVRSTDLLSLPNVNPDAGYGMQISYEESLTDVKTICFQAALLYTNSEGERRIRVHTICLPVTSSLPEVMHAADTEAIIGLLSKMAVDRSVGSNLSDARDAFINATIDVFNAFKIAQNLPSGQSGQLIAPRSLALLPLYILALLKHPAFRVGTSTRLDDRVHAMDCMKTLPLDQLMKYVYPELYKIDSLIYHARNSNVSSTQDDDDDEDNPLPDVQRLQLSAEHLDSRSIFLMDCGTLIMIYVGLNVPPDVLESVIGVKTTAELGDYVYGLPNIVSAENDLLKRFILRLNYDKPYAPLVQIIRDTSTAKAQFIERLTDDRSESSLSYYEFLQHIRAQVK